jgi:hypothetical protein
MIDLPWQRKEAIEWVRAISAAPTGLALLFAVPQVRQWFEVAAAT